MKAKWIIMAVLGSVAAWAADLGKWIKAQATTPNDLIESLKTKVAAAKAARAERKEKSDAAVANVDKTVAMDSAKDPVEFANDFIRVAGHDPVTKG